MAYQGGAIDTAFRTTWKTDNAGTSDNDQITIPTISGATYDCTVDWGDGTTDTITTYDDAAWTHTYAGGAGTYTVSISGTFGRMYFNNGGDKLKLLTVENWGDNVWESMERAFLGCFNMVFNASDVPDTSLVGDFYTAWNGCSSLTSFPQINTSSGTNFRYAWRDCSSLTSFPLLDTSSGTNFEAAWRGCSSLTSFPQINTSSGTNFDSAWYNCSSLTSFPLIDTSSGTDFYAAWAFCSSLTSFPTLNMGAMTNGKYCFYDVTLDTADYSALLVDIESRNSNNSVDFHGGNSTYNGSGATARSALVTDHSWTITDGGPA